MKRTFLSGIVAVICMQTSLLADAENLEIVAGSSGTYTASWDGVQGRTYLIQYTTSLEDSESWNYFPVVESGGGTQLQWGFSTPEPELYLRLVYTDVVVANPLLADFDGDNITTEDELNQLSTDPFNLDSDNDGTPDDEEDSDGDGYTDGEELNTLGSDPNDPDDQLNETDDNPEPAPPGSHQLVVVGDAAKDVPKTDTLTVNLPAETFLDLNDASPNDYLIVVAVDSDEFPEFTRKQSEFNDTVDWKVFVDAVEVESGNFAVNSVHQSWLEGIAFGREFRGYKPISYQHVSVIERPRLLKSYGPMTIEFELAVTNVADGDLPTTVIMALIPLDLAPTDNMIGIVGDEIRTTKGVDGERHFVSPKKTAEIPQDFVEFELKEITKSDFDAFLVYEGDGVEVLGDSRKRKIARDTSQKNTFTVKLNDDFDQTEIEKMNTWILWADSEPPVLRPIIASPAANILTGDGTSGNGLNNLGGYNFKFTITPSTIISPAIDDRPRLDGAPFFNGNNVASPGAGTFNFLDGLDLAQGVNLKWDVSRRVRFKTLNPHVYDSDDLWLSPGTIWANQPLAEDIAVNYPGNALIGNDDTATAQIEDNNPYAATAAQHLAHAIGQISSRDFPGIPMRHSTGNDDDTIEFRFQFGEFSRVLLNEKWYRCSDFVNWRFHSKMKRINGSWVNNGSDLALDNAGF